MVGFIIAVAAGYFSKMAEGMLARPVAAILGDYIKVEEHEIPVLGFMLVMLIAGVCSALLDSGTAFMVIFGGSLGYFGARIVTAVKTVINPPKNDG